MLNLLVLDEGLNQLWPQSTETMRKTFWKSGVGMIILWPAFVHNTFLVLILIRAFITLLFSSRSLTFCLYLWTEVGVSWESPEHIKYVEPPIGTQQSLSIHRGEQWYFVTFGRHNNMSLERKRFGCLS